MSDQNPIFIVVMIICLTNCVLSSFIELYNNTYYKKRNDAKLTGLDHLGKILCFSVCSVIFTGIIIYAFDIIKCPSCPDCPILTNVSSLKTN